MIIQLCLRPGQSGLIQIGVRGTEAHHNVAIESVHESTARTQIKLELLCLCDLLPLNRLNLCPGQPDLPQARPKRRGNTPLVWTCETPLYDFGLGRDANLSYQQHRLSYASFKCARVHGVSGQIGQKTPLGP